MKKMSIFVLLLILSALVVLALAADMEKQDVSWVTDGSQAQPMDYRAVCSMNHTSNTIASYFGNFAPGMLNVSYFNPADFCASPIYPYEITDFSFTLYDPGVFVWPVSMDIVVFDASDSCTGPGVELCRIPGIVADSATFAFPNVGTVQFPTPCCVNGPFYIGIEYTNGTQGSIPSICFDDTAPPDSCINWFFYLDGVWYEWFNFWTAPVPGYPMFWVGGETESANCQQPCGWVPGDPYKMHFPQLPDEAGWDVNATFPSTMADDFQCIETGWIKDIHFWGSWRDGVEGVIDSFGLSLHKDIPADQNPDGYSKPGELLWYRVVNEWMQTPILGASVEGWMDPLTGDVRENNHTEYFQYDVCFDNPDDWFWQEQDTIYWLDVTAFVQDTVAFRWGWKTSVEHFTDDAVYMGGPICTAPDNGTGTVDLPADCPYVDDNDPLEIIDGLPPGTTIECDPTLDNFTNKMEYSGGSLGGDVHEFDAGLTLVMTGTGDLTGFNRTVTIPVHVEIHTGPRNPGDPVQTFPTEIWSIQGQIIGDPDFDQLSFTAGVDLGLPGPGQMTLTRLPDGDFQVESFFDVTYQIQFTGAPGSVLEGYAGTTMGTSRWTQGTDDNWIELREPVVESDWKNNMWWIEFDPLGQPVGAGGTGYYDDGTSFNGWYFYPMEDWWNIWFYDHPYNPTRWKEVHLDLPAGIIETGSGAFVEIAVNWSTAQWSIDQPVGDSSPPLPPVDELLYVGRTILYSGPGVPGPLPLDFTLPEYNPEWVSVDVRGQSVLIPEMAIIDHSCTGWSFSGQSLDMAFVITGGLPVPDSGACCYDPTGLGVNSDCIYTTEDQCVNTLGGVYEGNNVPCQGVEACCLQNGECVMADALCCVNELGGTPQGAGSTCTEPQACCMPDGTCQELDPLCCLDLGGTPQGIGTQCGNTVACCMPDGSCQTVDSLCCDDLGGTISPIGAAACLGDNNGNGMDDACELPGLKWFQPPDLESIGMDVHATAPFLVLADDYLCTETGPIYEIHVWGSWLNDVYPLDPGNVIFTLSIHSDIPQGPDGWSIPGEPLWIRQFQPGQFDFLLYQGGLIEGWYDPIQGLYLPEGDTQCWEYIFHIDTDSAFIQQGSEDEPIVYWLDVQAQPLEDASFGWKTSTQHWNDDAVWADGIEPPAAPWFEMFYPPTHPFEGMSIDLAFAIYGMECSVLIGDANNSGGATPIDIDDVVYLINYIFGGGPAPVPYAVASGDADCSCAVDIDDVVYLINYIFGGGPAPCTCAQWVALCGPLH